MQNQEETKINDLSRFINKKKEIKIIDKKVEQKIKVINVVRLKTETITSKEINHEIINYNNNEYVVCCIPFNNEHKIFIIDNDNKNDVINKSWHYRINGGYIASVHFHENVKKELYLHNFVMNKLTFDGKGQQHTIDHINRIGTDNRKCNLREVTSQSAQNFNQQKRERIRLSEGKTIIIIIIIIN